MTKREDAAYKPYTRDRRRRTTAERIDYKSRPSYQSHENNANDSGEIKRHSFNPNFSRDNKLIGERPERDFNSIHDSGDERRFDRPRRSFDRGENSSYGQRNSGGGYRREGTNFNRRDDGGFNRREDSGFSRREDSGFSRREDGGGFNRREDSGFNRREGSGYTRRESPFGSGNAAPRERAPRTGDRPARPYDGRPRQYDGKPRQYDKPRPYGNQPRKPFDRNQPRQEGGYSGPKYDAENYPKYPAPVIETTIRLNRYVAMSGICSRREADTYITAGVVSVNGQVVTELGTKVSQNDVVKFNDEQIQNEKKVYILMNKPRGYVTSLEDPHADKTVMDLMKNACKERIYPVGRLDKNSMGVLLITNDGDLAKRLTHPDYAKKKIYQVTLDKPLANADMDKIVNGIVLEDGEIHADAASYVGEKKNEIGIEIHSGKNRIVRRMFESVGYKVGKLDRVYFAGLTKQKLKRGAWRFLTPREVSMLKSGSYE